MRRLPKLSSFPEPMRFIGDTVLNHKKDIKFHRSAETRSGAGKFAANLSASNLCYDCITNGLQSVLIVKVCKLFTEFVE